MPEQTGGTSSHACRLTIACGIGSGSRQWQGSWLACTVTHFTPCTCNVESPAPVTLSAACRSGVWCTGGAVVLAHGLCSAGLCTVWQDLKQAASSTQCAAFGGGRGRQVAAAPRCMSAVRAAQAWSAARTGGMWQRWLAAAAAWKWCVCALLKASPTAQRCNSRWQHHQKHFGKQRRTQTANSRWPICHSLPLAASRALPRLHYRLPLATNWRRCLLLPSCMAGRVASCDS